MAVRRVVLVAALGYFVDIFDLFLFSVLRVPSLQGLGLDSASVFAKGALLLNAQMAGLLVGGFFWGIAGDRLGRVKILYASILVYSLATFANAFVYNVEQYFVCRLIAGFGLAGELGAAITLVSEVMTRESRGIGTTIVGAMGLAGGIAAAFFAKLFDWRVCYAFGGILGLFLLILRFRLQESRIFLNTLAEHGRGSLRLVFLNPKRFLAYLRFLLIGVPIWFVAGIIIAFSPELSWALGTREPVSAADAVLYSYFGVTIGDVVCGYVSQKLKSRKRVLIAFVALTAAFTAIYFSLTGVSSLIFLAVCFLVGFGTGYWAVLLTMVAEYFGTNIRATVTTTIPNFIRASAIPMTLAFKQLSMDFNPIESAIIVALVVFMLAALALYFTKDTFATDLNVIEHA